MVSSSRDIKLRLSNNRGASVFKNSRRKSRVSALSCSFSLCLSDIVFFLLFFFFSPTFLCMCGEQPTSALFFSLSLFFSGSGIWNLSKIYRSFHQALPRWGERREKGRDREMTISLFFCTLISLEDKWNHMLAAIRGENTEQKKSEGKESFR